ncbi:Arylsulfatase [Symmachiella dynata]|uniref:Arylsulfatase n=1 Tax=Symmachiella dynata TaxID=2527995 RepID=A0A517ZNM8_9PLAN|nr:sulfatase [Symmachiella dynata]QDT48501.1 Arylsulfatase [Symmachiella dynata]QDU44092.1 Arylsulfatase [Symmachiella dynata]
MRLMLGGMLLLMCGSAACAEERPNFIVFIADDMAWDDCGAYGHPHIRTPNIDGLARDGLRFDSAFLTCSSCSPSRCSILTGRYPHNTGASELHQPLPADQITVARRLKEAGYYTASAGKWHIGPSEKKNFDRIHNGREKVWLQAIQQRPLDQPFFLWMAFFDPHRPYQEGTIDEPHKPSDAVVPPYLPDVPETRRDLAMYYDEIARMDGVIGDVLAELDKQGAADNTVVVFLSDNGRPFPRGKTTVYDSGVKTPWIVRWPKQVTAGGSTDSLISSIDLSPTLLELAGLDVGPTFQGKSFSAVLSDPNAEVQDAVFAEHNWHDFNAHSRAIRTAQYKFIDNTYTDLPGTPPADAVRGETYQAMLKLRAQGKLTADQQQCFTLPRPAEELYDLQNDPYELQNLANDPQFTAVRDQLRAKLSQWKQQTNDTVPKTRRSPKFDRETGERLQ